MTTETFITQLPVFMSVPLFPEVSVLEGCTGPGLLLFGEFLAFIH